MQITIQATLPTQRQLNTQLIWTESGWTRRTSRVGEALSQGAESPAPNLKLVESSRSAWEALFDEGTED